MHTLSVCATVLRVTFISPAGTFALGGTSANEAFDSGRMAGWFCRRQCVKVLKQTVPSLSDYKFCKQIGIIMKNQRNRVTDISKFTENFLKKIHKV